MQRIAKMLYLWTGDRPYGKLLDGQGTLRTDARVCTFDLKGLSQYPDLQAVMILILTGAIIGDLVLLPALLQSSLRKWLGRGKTAQIVN